MAEDRRRRDADNDREDYYGRDWETGGVRRFGPENYGGYGRGGVDYEKEGFQPVGGYLPEERGGPGRRALGRDPFDPAHGGGATGRGRRYAETYGPGTPYGVADRRSGGRHPQEEVEPGPHRGKGPRGYRRSDERIRDDVNDRLTDDAYVDASDVEVAVKEGEVTLGGFVDSRAAKRRAEDVVDAVSGVAHVQNNLRVRTPRGTAAGASAMAERNRG
ncbi:BON domain-containing protein [Azospirillum sp. A39]|uniref:BON domain-containing protein n=1 Tax=Azospirillum sp. A39 TaxID=3462279 RepID=UPI00404592C3